MASPSLTSSIITANRGFKKETSLQLMSSIGLSFIFAMPDHIWKVNPFVASSLLAPDRLDVDGSEDADDAYENDGNLEIFSSITDGQRSILVIQDAPCYEQALYTATKPLIGLGSQ